MRVCLLICLLLLVGCSDDKQKAVVPAPMKSIAQLNLEISSRFDEQMAVAEKLAQAKSEEAERIRFTELLQGPLEQWIELSGQLPGKKLKEGIEIGAKMAAIRVEMSTLPTTPCTLSARQKIFSGMDQVNDALEALKSVKGAMPEALTIKLGIGENVAHEGAIELIACKKSR